MHGHSKNGAVNLALQIERKRDVLRHDPPQRDHAAMATPACDAGAVSSDNSQTA